MIAPFPLLLLFVKPSSARSLGWVLFLALAQTAGAQEPALTENEIVVRALQRPPLTEALEGAAVAEEGRGRAAGAYPNPQISYSREQTFGPFGTGENYLSLSQTIDLGNRRGLQAKAGAIRAQAVRRESEVERLAVAADARLRFHEVLSAQLRMTALETWAAHVSKALASVTRREQLGDVSTYDRKRLEREQAVASGRLATEAAALEGARARLGALVGSLGPSMRVTGTLLPDADPPDPQTLRAAAPSRPDFVALELRAEASTLDRTAASRWWLPDLRLEGGWKGVELGANQRTDGFLAGASLALPLWDRSSGLAAIAEGEARAARGRRALLESQLEGQLEGARSEALLLRRAAAQFHERASAASAGLMRMASVAYEGGELGMLELLDAYRGAVDDELTTISTGG